jgi:hypothetical protein
VTHRESIPRRTAWWHFTPNNLEQIRGHVFYLALGYFVSYLPYAVLAKALSIGIVPGVQVVLPAGALEHVLVMPIVVVCAAVALSRPAHWRGPGRAMVAEPRGLLVCGELDAQGAAMTDAAAAILQDAGISPHRHRLRSRPRVEHAS